MRDVELQAPSGMAAGRCNTGVRTLAGNDQIKYVYILRSRNSLPWYFSKEFTHRPTVEQVHGCSS